jgi:peptidoglycan/xylan/chitin deacetylase (PgdA/CDA1 family)
MRRLIIWSCLISPPLAVAVGWLLGWPCGLALLLPAGLLWLWATLVPRCAWWGPQLSTFQSRHREVLLTFDDGPCPSDTPKVLDMLDAAGAKAVFFINGRKARQHPQLVREIAQRGHALGCHTMTDPRHWWWAYPAARQHSEIKLCLAALHNAVPGCIVTWCRTPAGMRNHSLHAILAEHHLQLMAWSATDGEWRPRNEERTLITLKRAIDKGSIVQLHEDRPGPAGTSQLIPVLEELLFWLKAQSYEIGA